MNFSMRAALLVVIVAVAAVIPTSARAVTLDREFTFDASRVALHTRDGITEVRMAESSPTLAAGHPDLPFVSERISIPGAGRVTGVQVLSFETAPLARDVRLPSAPKIAPGLPVARTRPDPEWFGRAGFQPSSPVTLGYQGWMGGRNIAYLSVSPVRWDATTGALQRITRLRVRLTIQGQLDPPVVQERVASATTIESGAARDEGAKAGAGFEATQIPSLLGSPVEYVIITSDALASEFQRLADWKTQSGVPAVVRTVSFIESQYPGGADDAERIRMFIRDAYQRWGVQWVLLGGDTDVIPTRYVYTTYYGGESIACDMYYSCLDGNWNADGDALYGEGGTPGDNADLLPEVWVGRAPVTTPDEAHLFVDKSLQYVRQPAGDYENTVLFFAEVLFPQDWQPGDYTLLDGAEIAEACLPYIKTNPSIHYARLYQNYQEPSYEPGALEETRAVVLDSLEVGYNVASHIGHGYRNVMSVGDANLDNNDAKALTNGNHLINLYASNCTSNAIDFPSIGEAFCLAPNGGAVTNIGSSRFDFPVVGQYYEEEYFQLLYQDSVTAVGEAQGRQKLPFVTSAGTDNLHRWTQTTLLLLGDPELRIYTGTPRLLSVTHPASLSLSGTGMTVGVSTGGNPLAGAKVTAYKEGDVYVVGTTDAAGNVTLPFQADSLGDLTLTVTGFDCKPFQAIVPVVATGSAALADLPPTVIDDGSGGTVGNGNGSPDEGETVDVHVPVRNNGGSAAFGVSGALSTPTAGVAISGSPLYYGTVGAGATLNPGAFRLTIAPGLADQTEVPFTLTLTASGSGPWVKQFSLTVNAPTLLHVGQTISDAGGNNDNRPDPGETVSYGVRLRNMGTGAAEAVTAVLRNHDGLAVVTDSTSAFGTIAPGTEATGDPMVFVPSSTGAILELRVSDAHGLRYTRNLDLIAPTRPTGLSGFGAASSIKLTWNPVPDADLFGYNVYRSLAPGGPFDLVNPIPTDRISYYLDDGLAPLTPYYYRVAAVDSSGNESDLSDIAAVSTNPPSHAVFPIPMGTGTYSAVAVDHIWPGYPLDIVASSDVLYMWHPDGTAPVDADGAGATSGDFTRRGSGYLNAPSIADLDGDGVKEIVGVASDSGYVFTFNRDGSVRPGWPQPVDSDVWASVAVGDLDGDGKKELVFTTNGWNLYAYHEDGTEVLDGDNNPATKGIFKVLSQNYDFGTPALADLEGNGHLDIIVGELNHRLDAWRADGTSLPGFPIMLPGRVTASVAVGHLDGPGDTQYDIVVETGDLQNNVGGDSVYVFRADGTLRPGWPRHVPLGGTNRSPSPALADMNNDGFLDVVVAGTNGGLYVFDRNGAIIPPFDDLPYSKLTIGSTQSSPIVADINGDGINDILMGDESGSLAGISGTGAMLPGFPILVEGEVKATPAVCDCDGDGMTEIVLGGWDRNVYVWDYDYPFSPSGPPPWPQYNHDAAHTGRADSAVFTAVHPGATTVRTLEFGIPSPNPARGGARTWYAIPAADVGEALEVDVLDLAGRRVRLLEHGAARTGRYSVAWDLRDDTGRMAANGIYFLRLRVGGTSLARKIAVMH